MKSLGAGLLVALAIAVLGFLVVPWLILAAPREPVLQ